jgi:hypothetical protein
MFLGTPRKWWLAGVPLMLGFVLLATADATMPRPRSDTLGVVR